MGHLFHAAVAVAILTGSFLRIIGRVYGLIHATGNPFKSVTFTRGRLLHLHHGHINIPLVKLRLLQGK